MARVLHLTLTPDRPAPRESWHFRIPGTRQAGTLFGDLPAVGLGALRLARSNGWRSVRLRIPKARWFGLGAVVVDLRENTDVRRLERVDADRLRRRHRARGRADWWPVLPVVRPAVP